MIRQNIIRICKEQGRSVTDLENGIKEHGNNISKGYIYNMVNPTYKTLKIIADELHVDVCDLIADS